MNIFKVNNFFGFFMVALAITSCVQKIEQTSSLKQESNCRQVQHQMGEAKICDEPKRIVALGPNVLEPLLALQV